MSIRKTAILLMMPLVCAAFLSAQDLVELAKKEKARRAQHQEKKTTVVTNQDLKKVQVKSGVSLRSANASEAELPVTTVRSSRELPADEAEPEERGVRVTLAPGVDQAEGIPEISLEEKLRRADNQVGHLNLKLTQLGQLFYNAETTERSAQIQKQIDSATRELEKAATEAERLRAEFEIQQKK